jgi:rhodanese-related sulfurtransferase
MKKVIALTILIINIAIATGVKITEDMTSIIIKDGDRRVEIKRIQDIRNKLPKEFTKTSRECPPFCIQPMYIYNVKPIGEIELLKHLRTLEEENILLIDARSREWHKRGTIPTATNLPFTMLKEGNDNLPKVLKLLGAKRDGDKWDFTDVPKMLIFGNGIWDPQATKEIKSLLSLGCPDDKILYYRGGMQDWYLLGFTVEKKD